jgi:outer membrane protein assembly factor BamB
MKRATVSFVSLLGVVSLLGGCSFLSKINPFGNDKFKPAPLVDFKPSLKPQLAWAAKIGESRLASLQPAVVDRIVYAASEEGVVVAYDVTSGKTLWRRELKQRISSGVAATGDALVMVAEKGKIIALDDQGKDLWSAQASTEVITPPTAALGVVLVRASDGRITAFEAKDGKRKWSFQRQLPPLTLRNIEPISIHQSTAYVGYPGGKLIALNLANGNVRWESTVALPKGATEIERIADVSGAPVISLRQVCAASFQGRIGCFDLQNGSSVWTRDFSTSVGLSADDRYVIAFTEKGEMSAFSRDGGPVVWKNETYLFRKPGAPVIASRAAVFSDVEGYMHWVGRDDGKPLARLSLNGGAASGGIIQAEKQLFVQTRGGYLNAIALD